jgi:hypothetical protein
MAAPAWHVEGQYYENCSCDYVCPCVLSQMMVKPSQGWCTFAMAFRIDRGSYGGLPLDGLGFMILGHTPEEMGKGNWSVGVIVDERASPAQRDAITGIASGSAGGPMAALGGLVGKFLGVESAPIVFDRKGEAWSANAGNAVHIEGEGARGLDPNAPPLQLANTGHPAANAFFLARTHDSRVAALGLSWSDKAGRNNAQYAPFSWRA